MMDGSGLSSSLRKSYSNEPRRTLSFVDVDSDNEHSSISESLTHVKHKSKTEKSVHFADEESIVEEDGSSLTSDQLASEASEDGITWLPSEHLYSDDTFIHDTETTPKASSIPTYGSSTFVELDSNDEDVSHDTDTEQLYSYTDSFVSSDVFTTQSGTTTYKSWKDVTEIVKDIEELEQSEFVTRPYSLDFEGDETEASESLDEEETEAARLEFVTFALRRLRLKELQSPRSLAVDSDTSGSVLQDSQYLLRAPPSKEEKRFCQKMIEKCKKKSENLSTVTQESNTITMHPLYKEVARLKNQRLEYYGLNSALVERLRLDNLHIAMEKKSHDLDKDISRSNNFVKNITEDETIARDQYVSQMCASVRRENMEEAIQAHLIKMHPVTKFAEFVKDLPKADEDSREILYKYKRQLENRMSKNPS